MSAAPGSVAVDADPPPRGDDVEAAAGLAERADAPTDLAELGDPATRGRTVVDDRVVEKIAARAVAEVDLATGAPRTLLGQTLGAASEDTAARTSARVDGDLVLVEVTMAVRYPASVRQVAADVRRHVGERIRELTDLEVAQVDITVPSLLTAQRRRPRVR